MSLAVDRHEQGDSMLRMEEIYRQTNTITAYTDFEIVFFCLPPPQHKESKQEPWQYSSQKFWLH